MSILESLGIILLIVTSNGEMDNGKPTGLWLEEFAVPYEIFTEAGYEVVIASPKGGVGPVDPRSLPEKKTEAEQKAIDLLQNTIALADLPKENYDAVFFAGGHGTMFDFPNDENVQKIVSAFFKDNKPIAFVCHGPAALVGARTEAGEPVAKGRKLTGFTNSEEDAVNLTDQMPFLLETELKKQGATFTSAANFQPFIVVDENLVTGQNPPSSKPAAEALLKLLEEK